MLNLYTIPQGVQPTEIAANLPAGSTIINLDSNNTVQLSRVTGMQWGNGIPLPPLSPQTTQSDGPLYALVDPAASGTVQIVVTDEFTSYDNPVALASAVATKLLASGVPIVQSAKVIGAGVGISTDYDTGIVDLGNNQTLFLYWSPNADVVNDLYYIKIFWYDGIGGNVLDYTPITAGSKTEGQLPITARFAVRSRYCRVTVHKTSTDGNVGAWNMTVRVTANTASCARDTVRTTGIITAGGGLGAHLPPLLLASGSPNIAAGSFKLWLFGPVTGKILVYYYKFAAPNGTCTLQLSPSIYDETSGQMYNYILGQVVNNTTTDQTAEFDLPFGCYVVANISNNDTVSRAPSFIVYDVSGI